MSLRTKLIQRMIGVNEQLVFYPKLKGFYRGKVTDASTVIDVGANKGQSIHFFRSIAPRCTMYAFEPNRKLFGRLSARYGNTVTLVNKGVSDSNGTLSFRENVLDETSTFEELNFDSEYLRKKARVLGVEPSGLIIDTYDVEVTTLSAFLREKAIRHVHVLKVDVEGHELQVLRGLFTDMPDCKVDYIQLESHNDDMYVRRAAGEIEDLLKHNGYSEAARLRHGFGDFYELIYGKRK
jgi:FkbM family methyltransferase